MSAVRVLYALPFRRPWGEAIVRPVPAGATAPGPKRIDNRRRKLNFALDVSLRIVPDLWTAVYATHNVDRVGLAWINQTYDYGWTEADFAPGGTILGAVQFRGYVVGGEHPWYFGSLHNGSPNFGWVIDRAVTFAEPVPVKPRCARGVWLVPEPARARCVELIEAALR